MATTTIADVRTIGVDVSDQDDALAFYVDTLGFEKRLDAPISDTMRWLDGAPRAGSDTGIRFVVPDAAAEHDAMRQRDITVGELLLWDDVPPMFTFDDPDGNRFYIVEES